MTGPAQPQTCGTSGGTNADGRPCGSTLGLSPTNGLCLQHDPERTEERRAVVAAGGRAAGEKARQRRLEMQHARPEQMPDYEPDTLERVALWHQWASKAVGLGWIDARTSDSLCRHLKELRPTLVAIGHEQRVKELERELQRIRKRESEGRQ